MSDDLISRARVFERLEYTRPPEGGDSTKERFRFLQWLADNQIIKETPSAERSDEAEYWHEKCQRHEQTIVNLANALAERRGKWIPKDERWRCTLCDGIAPKGIRWNYCPNCGAKMIADKDDTQ